MPYQQAPYQQAPYGDPYAQQPYGAPKKTSGWAIATLILGIVGAILFSVICGVVALKRTRTVARVAADWRSQAWSFRACGRSAPRC
jgi:hypothetical protein